MDKVRAEEIIKSAFTTILDKLHTQDEYNSRLIVDDFHALAKSLSENGSIPLDLHLKEQNFEDKYKEIAKDSIKSYEKTTSNIKSINEEQHKILEKNSTEKVFNIEDIAENFTEMHQQTQKQIKDANETIKNLHKQISILEKTSNLDPLTRTFNRRALDKYLQSVCNLKNTKNGIHIMLIDIDDFKKINDTYGHLAGDRVLMFLARLISNSIRDGDKVFRFGGEEFLVILNRADETARQQVAQRILKGARINTLLYKDHHIKITLSIGATAYKVSDNCDTLIERADKALYKAKHSGKDQLIIG